MNYRVKKTKTLSKKIIIISVLLIFLICTFTGIGIYQEAQKILEATKEYNVLVRTYNDISKEYDTLLMECSVDNIDGIPTGLGILQEEPEDVWSAVTIIFGENNVNKIKNDSKTIQNLIDEAGNWTDIIKQITSPSEKWVVDRLKQVSDIKEVQAVTKSNNPDGLLNKEGGYKACVYFTTNLLNPSLVEGKSIVEKGTDAGGTVEVYATLEEAEARCSYLAGFDGTILYSGSYAIVGTMVIRTSYMFSGDGQVYLTDEIVKAFTSTQESEFIKEENVNAEIDQTDSNINELDEKDDVKVEKILAYRFTSALPVFKKEVVKANEIKRICQEIQNIRYEEYSWRGVPATKGPAPTLFEFYLSNGKVHQVKFLTYGEKGEQLIIDGKEYRYEGNPEVIYKLWNSLSGTEEQVDRDVFIEN